MDTMETIEVATGLSMELKMAVAVCVVLATMLVLTMVSTSTYESSPPRATVAARHAVRRAPPVHAPARPQHHRACPCMSGPPYPTKSPKSYDFGLCLPYVGAPHPPIQLSSISRVLFSKYIHD